MKIQDRTGKTLSRFTRALIVSMALAPLGAIAQDSAPTVSFQFSQSGFADGGVVRGFVSGQDLDGDGKLYMMGTFGVDLVGYPAGDEVEFMTITMENVNGRTFTQRYDRNVANASHPDNFFFGVSYNLDGGELGDDADEGLSFAPLAPSTSYTIGTLFSPFISPIPFDDPLLTCGQPDVGVCANILTLNPGEVFPEFELLFADFSAGRAPTTEKLRFSFSQDGFPDGTSVHGTITGRDLNGDGRLYSMSSFLIDNLGFPAGDPEIDSVTVTIENFDGGRALTQVFDNSVASIDAPQNIFMGFSYDLDGGPIGDVAEEGISLGPLAPSTSYFMGPLFSGLVSPIPFSDTPLVTCGDPDAGVCAAITSLVPGDEIPQVAVTFSAFSAAVVGTAPSPARVEPSYSGSWYDTERNGEGIMMHRLPDGRTLVYWGTYDANGGQRWFVGTGRYEGTTVFIDELFVTEGGVFGQGFDPDAVNLTTIGSLTIEFQSCNTGTLNYVVDGASGSMNLSRLTGVAGLPCTP